MRILHSRDVDFGLRIAGQRSAGQRSRRPQESFRQSVPLHRLQEDHRSCAGNRGRSEKRTMSDGGDAQGAVGKSIAQLEAQEKASGDAKYIGDLYRPKMLHAAVLQSPHAHARILRYDLAEALALPGVRAVVTGDDVSEANRMGAFIKDEHAIAKDKVRYVGEAVAAVAADTEAIAR